MAIKGNNSRTADEPRIAREKRTITAMIRIYCRGFHDSGGEVCTECDSLRQYAMHRLDRCPFGPDKPTCAKCPNHCYKPQMRERIREVMRFSGPRMFLAHPLLAVCHLLDAKRPWQ